MYSKNKGLTDRDYTLTPPPGYDGSRFRRRSDGRDDAFPMYSEPPQRIRKKPEPPPCPLCDDCPVTNDGPPESCECQSDDSWEEKPCEKEAEKEKKLLSFLQGIGGEELLLIALIILLAKDGKAGIETVLILALLLCIS